MKILFSIFRLATVLVCSLIVGLLIKSYGQEIKNTKSARIARSKRPNAIPHWLNQIKDNLIIIGSGLAGIKLGDPENRVIAVLGTPTKAFPVTDVKNNILFYALNYKYDGLFLGVYMTRDTRVVSGIRLSDSNFNRSIYIPTTPQGVTIGNSEEQLRQFHGPPVNTDEHFTCPNIMGNNRATTLYYIGISFWVCEANKLVYLIDINRNNQTQFPTSGTFDIPTAKGNVTVKNFYKTSGLTTERGAVEMRNDEYQIAFDGLNYYNFFIHLPFIPDSGDIPPNWDFRRSKAEQDFLEILGISKTDACKLKVNVGFAGTHNELAETYAGINFGLSFCPNGLPIPPLNLSKSKSKTSTTRSTVSAQTLPAKVRALLNKSYSNWKLNLGDKICDSQPFVSGDFDGNKKTDYAVMFTSGRKGYIIAFLANAVGYRAVILETNSASNMKGSFLSINRKGDEYDQIINEDFDRERHKLKTDAPVSGECESSAYLYVYNKGKFERAFVSD